MEKMKIEKRGNSVFISHSGLTVFCNKIREGFTIKATERLENGSWREAGFMKVQAEDFRIFFRFLEELAE
jgi:hypothetical protein